MSKKQQISTAADQERIVYLDALRVAAVFAVIVIHLAATGYQEAARDSCEWDVCLTYNTVTRFAVPVFVMISGAIHLNPERKVTMAHLLKKVGRLMAAFFFWSLLYALTESLKTHTIFSSGYFLSVVRKTVTGHYHMWYIYMISVLYLATPFFRPIAADRKLLRMFLVWAFLFNHGIRALGMIPGWEDTLDSLMNSADIGIFSGYSGYYCLGYYLHSGKYTKKQVGYFALASAALLAVAILVGIRSDSPNWVFSEKMPHVFLFSAVVFLLFQSAAEQLEQSQLIKVIIRKLAPCTFGIYLVHPVFNFLFRKAGLFALTFHPLLGVPLVAVLVCAASFTTVLCMRKIPLLKRFV